MSGKSWWQPKHGKINAKQPICTHGGCNASKLCAEKDDVDDDGRNIHVAFAFIPFSAAAAATSVVLGRIALAIAVAVAAIPQDEVLVPLKT